MERVKLFECMNCGKIFSLEEAAEQKELHDEVHPHYTEVFLVCPACLSGSFIDHKEEEQDEG